MFRLILKIKIIALILLITNALSAQELYAPNTSGSLSEMDISISGNIVTVEVETFDSIAVLEGDMIIRTNSTTGRGIGAVGDIDNRWERGIIPYTIADGHSSERIIRSAIEELNNLTLLNFVERTNQSDYLFIQQPRIGCSAELGKVGGRQYANISSNCPKGTIIHELLHTAGFFHEQSRTDRDGFVIINWNNIIKDKRHNFKMLKPNEQLLVGGYDFESIMHYPGYTNNRRFAIDISQPIIITRNINKQHIIGNRNGLSSQDIIQINKVYGLHGRGGDSSTSSNNNSSWPIEDQSSFDIQYQVELVPQLTGVSCWAAGAAMIVGWRDEICINPEEVARGVGYWSAYYNNGLPPDDTGMFEIWGLQKEAPMSYTIQGLRDLIASYGPLWVATAEPGPHIRVISGIAGDGTPDGTILTIQDPWQRGMRRFRTPNNGSTYTETFTEFMRKQAELARTEFNIAAPIYITHN